jgi:EAL domain-containing protein (putative c-di-GMP-specific phosphodiesterase class I)
MAAELLHRWKGTPLQDLYVSINVDPSDFYYFDVPEHLKGLCEKYGLDTHKLRVEITETALVDDAERQSRIVETLHDAGFIVEIDDFGKGSSSLSMLKDIHADVLKIDMGFIRGKSNLYRSRIILASVIDMAEQLEMGVITEGVETREQVDRLSDMGCENFQGFFFSRPIPVEDFETVALQNLGKRG